MNLGRETKSAVSSRYHNKGSDRSNKSFTKKPSKKSYDGNVNEPKLKPIIENNGVKSENDKTVKKRSDFGTKANSFDKSTYIKSNKAHHGGNELKKNQCKDSFSSITSVEKSDGSKNYIKDLNNIHHQQILHKRSHSLDGNEDSFSSRFVGKNTRRQSYAIPNEVSFLSSNTNKIKPKMSALATNYSAARQSCIQEMEENANEDDPSMRNNDTFHQNLKR